MVRHRSQQSVSVNETEEAERLEFERLLAGGGAASAAPRAAEPQIGQRMSGLVVGIDGETIFLDLGEGWEGLLDASEVRAEDGTVAVALGERLEAVVAARDESSRGFVMRRRSAGRPGEIGLELRQAHELRLPVDGTVRAVNKGGFEVDVAGAKGFCPLSQIDLKPGAEPESWIGRKLSFAILRLEEGGRGRSANVVLSRRELLEREARERAAELRARLAPGAVLRGRVTSLASYGAFVDLGGLEGMIHASELAHRRVEHPKELLEVGQEVEVQVLRIEPAKADQRHERIALSMKALAADPWKDAETRFAAGSEWLGRVQRLEPYGAFVEIAPGLQGLLPISELGRGRRLQHAREATSLGADLRVRVAEVDRERRRISLALVAAGADLEAAGADWRGHEKSSGSFGSLGDFLRQERKR